jgi:hypothetical protein
MHAGPSFHGFQENDFMAFQVSNDTFSTMPLLRGKNTSSQTKQILIARVDFCSPSYTWLFFFQASKTTF